MKPNNSRFLVSMCLIFLVNNVACRKFDRPAYREKAIIRTELQNAFSFPDENLDKGGPFLANPRYMSADRSGNIFVSDQSLNSVLVFKDKGEFLYQFGKKGQGPGDFDTPSDLEASDSFLLVKESYRFQYLDKLGKHLKSFADFKGYYRFSLRKDGYLYALPMLKNADTKLIDVISPEGQVVSSFGNCLAFKRDMFALNYCDLKVYDNCLYIAFMHFPIVRKYSEKGELMNEFKLAYGSMLQIEQGNLESYEGNLKGKRSIFTGILDSINVNEKGIYLMSGDKTNIEILKYDHEGKLIEVYWFSRPHEYLATEFLVKEEEGKDIFYVLQIAPEGKIDVFRPKT